MKTASLDSLSLPALAEQTPPGRSWETAKNTLLVTILLAGVSAYGFLLVASVIWITSR